MGKLRLAGAVLAAGVLAGQALLPGVAAAASGSGSGSGGGWARRRRCRDWRR